MRYTNRPSPGRFAVLQPAAEREGHWSTMGRSKFAASMVAYDPEFVLGWKILYFYGEISLNVAIFV